MRKEKKVSEPQQNETESHLNGEQLNQSTDTDQQNGTESHSNGEQLQQSTDTDQQKEDVPTQRKMFYKHTFESAAHSYCVFASDDIVDAIKEHIEPSKRRFYMDATFKICPVGNFKQLLILYIDFMGQVRRHFSSQMNFDYTFH